MSSITEEVKAILQKADAFCFDVDSTVITEEGIDELARFCGKGEEISRLTAAAMGGAMTYQDSLKMRLNIIKPSQDTMRQFISNRPPKLSPNVDTLVEFLHGAKIPVYLVSGGFRSIIKPIASRLNIPEANIFANRIKFYFDGEYAGFDENEPTSRTGGKSLVAAHLKEKHGYKNLVFVGDGATDLEASPPADVFIGYGGNVVREVVKANAKWFVTDFTQIINVLKRV